MPAISVAVALIIIDMQQGINAPRLGPRNNPTAECQIERLLAAWRRAQAPVIHVRHISRSPESVFWPGQPGAQFQPQFAPLAHEHVMEKNVPDAFANSGLERWLHARGIRNLVIVGVATNNSVESTARSAGNLGFAAQVVADACFTFAQINHAGVQHSAETVHVMALANLQGDYASIVSTDAVIETFGSGAASARADV